MLSDEEQAEGGEGEEHEGTGEMREKRRRMDQRDGPVRALLTEVIEQIDEMQLKVEDHAQALSRGANRDEEEEGEGGDGDAGRGYGQPQKRVYEEYEDEEEEEEDNGDDAMASRRLAKRRASSSGDRPPVDQEQWLMRRDVDGAQVSRMHVDSLPRVHDIPGRSDVVSEEQSAAPSSPDGLDTGDLTTVQQAMGELLKMQHAFAMNLSGGGGGGLMAELEKMNEARLREEEEKTKQRDLELLIERQRTKRRQIELEFERMERQKDREEQAKLIASIVERLQPPIKD
ncbi:unnamed protein product [Hyaloperonospora brassicae]|nr:unnamed protein product [Hyaloperonospora brassicae]